MMKINFSVVTQLRRFVRKLKEPENVVYMILVFTSMVLVTIEHGFDVFLQLVAVVFCASFIVRNVILFYVSLNSYFKEESVIIRRAEIIELVLTTLIVIALFLFYLSFYLVCYILVFTGVILAFVLLFKVIKNIR